MSSKIKVDTIENVAGSGNVSLGSGHNLVVPGNNTTSGNATVGGNLVVDTNTIYADSSSNKVGIGTSSPDTQLHISGNSSTRNSIVNCLTLDGGTAAANPYDGFGTGITFQGRDYGNAIRDYAYIRGQITHTTSNSGGGDAGLGTALTFWTTPTGAGTNVPLERMRVDKDGNVTMSNQPSFSASYTGTNGFQDPASGLGAVPFNTTSSHPNNHNIGNHYNTTNYRFTAPVAGRYLFVVGLGHLYMTHNEHLVLEFRKNGTRFAYQYKHVNNVSGDNYYDSGEMSTLLNLAVNDYVTFTMNGNGQYYKGPSELSFAGHLLG